MGMMLIDDDWDGDGDDDDYDDDDDDDDPDGDDVVDEFFWQSLSRPPVSYSPTRKSRNMKEGTLEHTHYGRRKR